MGPKILRWTFSDSTFYPLIDPQAIGFVALARKILHRWMNHQPIAAAVRQTLLSERHDPSAAQPGELAGRRHSRGLDAEQRHEHALPGAVILIRRVPDRPARAQQFEHATHIFTLDRQRIQIVTLTPATLDEVEQGVAVFAVHAVDGVLLTEQCSADLQGREMQGHQNHALAFLLRVLQMLQPFDMGKPGQSLSGPPPAHGHLEEGDAGGSEVFLEQSLAFGGGHLRKTKLQIARGNIFSISGNPVHDRAQQPTDDQQHTKRQLHDQPEKPQPQP